MGSRKTERRSKTAARWKRPMLPTQSGAALTIDRREPAAGRRYWQGQGAKRRVGHFGGAKRSAAGVAAGLPLEGCWARDQARRAKTAQRAWFTPGPVGEADAPTGISINLLIIKY